MTTYTLEISIPRDIPDDVLVEHIGAAIAKLLIKPEPEPPTSVKIVAKNGGKTSRPLNEYAPLPGVPVRQGRKHPFDGPEVFDDYPVPDDIMNKVFRAIHEDFPKLSELFQVKNEEREIKRNAEVTDPPAEGDWTLTDGDDVGKD